jgi:hypothetical protein
MRIEKIGLKIWDLQFDARDELYSMIDLHLQPLAKDSDGNINPAARGLVDNQIDALRHAYVSAVYTIEYGEGTADLLGRLREYFHSSATEINSRNMDLWNNSVGRIYGKKFKRGKDLFTELLKAIDEGKLILTPTDKRKYKGAKSINRLPKSFVIKIKENKSGANTEFLDVRNKIVMSKNEFILAIKGGKYPGYAIRKHISGEFPYSTRDRFSFNNLG